MACTTISVEATPFDQLWHWLMGETYGIPNWLIVGGAAGSLLAGMAIAEEERRRRELLLMALR